MRDTRTRAERRSSNGRRVLRPNTNTPVSPSRGNKRKERPSSPADSREIFLAVPLTFDSFSSSKARRGQDCVAGNYPLGFHGQVFGPISNRQRDNHIGVKSNCKGVGPSFLPRTGPSYWL